MKFTKTNFDGLFVIDQEPNTDARGTFNRLFCLNEFSKAGTDFKIVQVSRSLTKQKGTIRGLHYQKKPFEEDKLITCIKGKIFDVAVDIRRNSKTYGQWYSLELSQENGKMFFLPKGFAHGFQTLTDNCQLIYFMSEYYHPEASTGILWSDKTLNINWPYKYSFMSEKDKTRPLLEDYAKNQ